MRRSAAIRGVVGMVLLSVALGLAQTPGQVGRATPGIGTALDGEQPGEQPPKYQGEAPSPSVVFILDASASMADKWKLVVVELRWAITDMKPQQSFNIILMTDAGVTAFDRDRLNPVTPANAKAAFDFLGKVTPKGGKPDPIPAVKLALKQKTKLIYILSDAGFPDNAAAVKAINKLNIAGKKAVDADSITKINTLAFIEHGKDYEAALEQIAEDSGGLYHFVSSADLEH